MSSFVQSTNAGVNLVVSDEGERIPLYRDMKIGFDDIGGAQVWVERRNGHITCAAALPESKEPVLWRFDVCDHNVRTTHAPTPITDARSLQSLITDCRIGLNGKL
jgi:hypothetical protein